MTFNQIDCQSLTLQDLHKVKGATLWESKRRVKWYYQDWSRVYFGDRTLMRLFRCHCTDQSLVDEIVSTIQSDKHQIKFYYDNKIEKFVMRSDGLDYKKSKKIAEKIVGYIMQEINNDI